MKPFRFQKFIIEQDKDVFRVGTDGLLLGALCGVSKSKNALEVGSGTGLVSLMIAQRNAQVNITALDINPMAAALTGANFNNSPFADRLLANHIDFHDFVTENKFDFIVSNPPFFDENISEKDVLARQTVALNFRLLISGSCELLSDKGMLSVIIPADAASDFAQKAEDSQLHLIRRVNIYGISGGALKRNILEFSKEKSDFKLEDFTIEKSPRKYSDQYLEVTKDFHVFTSN